MRRGAGEGFVLVGLVLVCACTLVLHLAGLGQHLPHALEDDALQAEQASWLRHHWRGTSGGPPELLTQYPLALPALAALAPTLAPDPRALEQPTAADHLAKASERYLRMRLIVALVSLLAVPATFLLARSFLEPGWALLAATLLASALLPTAFAQQARPHGGFLGLCTLALLACVRSSSRGGWSAHALAGLACGAALATLHFGLFVLPPLVVAHALAPRRRLAQLGLALALVATCAWLAYPSLDGGFDLAWSTRAEGTRGGLHPSVLDGFHGGGVRVLLGELAAWDPVLLIGGAAGLVLGSLALARDAQARGAGAGPPHELDSQRRRALAVLLAFALPFAATVGAFDRSFARFLLPLYPLLALLSAGFARACARSLARALPAPLCATAVSAALLALPLAADLAWARLHLAPDTQTLAARWIEAHVDRERESILTAPHVSLPLLALPLDGRHPAPEWLLSPWERYQHLRGGANDERVPRWRVLPLYAATRPAPGRPAQLDPDGLRAELSRLRPDWVVLQVRPPEARDGTRAAVLEAGGVRVAQLDCGDPLDPLQPAFSLGRHALRHLLRCRRLGPSLEIYRMPS